MAQVDCVLDAKAKLGEARSVVRARAGAVVGRHRGLRPASLRPGDAGSDTSIGLPRRIGCFALREAGGFVVALEDGFHSTSTTAGGLTAIIDPEADRPGNRFNDGTTDHAGRFVAGTMPMGPREPVGALYRLWPDRRCETAVRPADRHQWLRLQPGRPDLLLLRLRGQRADDLGLRP